MSKFWTVDIIKCLVTIAMFFCISTAAATLPCITDLADLSFENVLNEYAELIYSLEEVPEDSSGASVIKSMVEAKDGELSSLIPEKDREAIASTLNQKISAIRRKNKGLTAEQEAENKAARRSEYNFFHHNFKGSETPIISGIFKNPKLSPDGKTFLIRQDDRWNNTYISLISLATGKEILKKKLWSRKAHEAKFISNGRYLQIDYSLVKSENPFIKTPWVDLQTREIFDCETGELILKKRFLGSSSKGQTVMDISQDGKMIIVKTKKAFEVISLDASGRTQRKINIKSKDGDKAWFDSTGKNIIISEPLVVKNNKIRVRSVDINKGVIKWEQPLKEIYLTPDRQFMVAHWQEPLSGELYGVLSEKTGKNKYFLPELNLDIAHTVASSNGLLFVPKVDRLSGYVYDLNGSIPVVQLAFPNLTWATLGQAHFIEDNTKLVGIYRQDVFVWNVTTGILLRSNIETISHLYGVDAQGNVVGSGYTGTIQDHYYKDLRLWMRHDEDVP